MSKKKKKERKGKKRETDIETETGRERGGTHTHTALITFGRPYGEESLEVVMYNFSLSIHHKYTA